MGLVLFGIGGTGRAEFRVTPRRSNQSSPTADTESEPGTLRRRALRGRRLGSFRMSAKGLGRPRRVTWAVEPCPEARKVLEGVWRLQERLRRPHILSRQRAARMRSGGRSARRQAGGRTGGMAGDVSRGLLEAERILLWLIGLLGAVTRDDLTKLLKTAGISCSTCDRAIERLEGRPSRRRRGGLGPWHLTMPGLRCPGCSNRSGAVTAVQLGSDRRGGVAITYGHGTVDAGPNALKGCRKTFTGEGAQHARLALKRYLLQPLPDQLVEQQHHPLAPRYLLQLNDAGRECLAADCGSLGRPTPGPFPGCDGGDSWQAMGRLLYAEFLA